MYSKINEDDPTMNMDFTAECNKELSKKNTKKQASEDKSLIMKKIDEIINRKLDDLLEKKIDSILNEYFGKNK